MIDLLIRVNLKKLFILSHIKNYDNYGCGRVGQRYTETTRNSDIYVAKSIQKDDTMS